MDKIVKILLLIFVHVWFIENSRAQTTTNSPYSIYGLGEPSSKSFAQNRSMGGTQTAIANPLYINLQNPASFAVLASPTFNVDINVDILEIKSNLNSETIKNAYLNDVAFGFPMGKRAGAAFSLKQYTKIGYNITANQDNLDAGNLNFVYEGTGGISQFVFGGGYAPILNDKHALLLGVNGNFYFGSAQTSRAVEDFVDDPSHLNSKILRRTNLKDLAVDFGALYKTRLNKLTKLSLGLTYAPSVKLKATREEFAFSYTSSSGVDRLKDTVNFSTQEGEVLNPSILGVGLSLEINKQWTLGADMKIQDWSELEILGTNQNLNPRIDYSFGAEFLPNGEAMSKYFEAIRYRAGFRYANTRLNIGGESLNETAGSFGIGLPVLKNKSKSTINIGMEFGNRRGENKSLIEEKYTYIFIGVSFNPHKYDAWFKRRKYE